MVVVSKQLFDAACRDVHCSVMTHPWNESCLKACPGLYKDAVIGSAKFYSIIYIAQILMRGKKMMKKDQWIKMGEYYVRSTMKMLGDRFYPSTYLFIPFAVCGLFIYLEPPSRRGLVINLFCNLENSQLIRLFTPEKVKRKTIESESPCPHKGKCEKYVAKGFATYFGVGLGISLARLILPKISTPIRAISSIRSKHFKLAMFFGSYIGIYRAVVCYLCRKKGFDSALYALPAGYAAGISFLFNPSLGLSIASLTAAFKLYSTILYEKKILPSNIPLPELLYCFCQGTLFNARILDPDACPSYVFNLMKSCSNG
ncbi:hypothetical protein HF086_010696, partial [Spodoptera exigua]